MKKIFSIGLIVLFFILPLSIVRADENGENSDQELEQLIQDLSSGTLDTRAIAAQELGSTKYKGNEKAFNALIQALNDGDFMVLGTVLSSLEAHENPLASEKIMSNLLWEPYPPDSDIRALWFIIPQAFKTIGLLGAPSEETAVSLIEDTFAYFLFQPMFSPIFEGAIREEATNALFSLFNGVSPENSLTLYKKWGPHVLKGESDGSFFGSDKFAKEAAWVFLHILSPSVSTELLNTMVHEWSPEIRWEFAYFYPETKLLNTSPITVKGRLDDQGKFIGRLGQFALKDKNNNTIVQIHVPKEKINTLYNNFWGKEVLLSGIITITQGSFNLFRKGTGFSYPLHLEFTDIKFTQ